MPESSVKPVMNTTARDFNVMSLDLAASDRCHELPFLSNINLDKNLCKRQEIVFVVGLPLGVEYKGIAEKLRDFSTGYLALPRFDGIYIDDNGVKRKLTFIRAARNDEDLTKLRGYKIDLPASPQTEVLYLESHPEAFFPENCSGNENNEGYFLPTKPCAFRLSICYENLPLDRALKAVLPENVDTVSGFSLVGHVAHFNLKPAALPYGKIIGQVVLDKLPQVRTVVNKAAKINNEFRTFTVDLMAGEPNYLTEVKENGATFRLDFSQVYWNSRLGMEHSRIVDEIRGVVASQVVVYDVFAGVGPFSIPLARCPNCRVLANDLNPSSFKFLEENVRINSSRKHPITEDRITCTNLDGREFIRDVLLVHYANSLNASQIASVRFFMLMNLPGLAIEFLDVLREFSIESASLPPPPIHTRCYCFVQHTVKGANSMDKKLLEAHRQTQDRVCSALAIPSEAISTDTHQWKDVSDSCFLTDWKVRFVRNTAPLRDMYCLEFDINFPVKSLSKRQRLE